MADDKDGGVTLLDEGDQGDAIDSNRPDPSPPAQEEKETDTTTQIGWKVWVIFSGLAVSALLSALEGSVISTALPTIAAELGSGGSYVWVINLYFLTR